MRINKYLATCGLASRRNCEKLILEGRVSVNNKKITTLAVEINMDNDYVTVDGNRVKPILKHLYLMVNKPKGYVCTTSDEFDRKTILDLLGGKFKDKRIFPIGRLDYDTEGLIILTTDGDLSNRLLHPRNEIPKTYVARIEGELSQKELLTIQNGVVLDGVRTKKCKVKLVGETEQKLDDKNAIAEKKIAESRVEITISQGKNRQVRRMFESINREVVFLKRVAIGDVRLGGLSRGEYRELKDYEINYLKNV